MAAAVYEIRRTRLTQIALQRREMHCLPHTKSKGGHGCTHNFTSRASIHGTPILHKLKAHVTADVHATFDPGRAG